MTTMRRLAPMLAVLLAAPPGAAELPPERMYTAVEVGPGVLAFISPETSGPIPSGNVVAVIGDDGVLVVDSGRFPSLARRMIADIRRRTDRPVRYVVHTHWHLDHMVGDGEFLAAFPGTSFVATDFTRRKMIEKQVGYLSDVERNDLGFVKDIEAYVEKGKRDDGSPIPEADARYLRREAADIRLEAAELAGAKVVEPDITFDRSLTVHLGRREVRVLFLGAGNTAGDTVVHVPDAKVVATGDLLVAPVPYAYGCHPAEWIETLKKLQTIEASAIVPGHGPVMHDWSYARRVSDLLEAVRSQVSGAVREGATLEQARARVDVESHRRAFAGDDHDRGRAFRDFFLRDAVTRARQEASGVLAEE